MNPPDMLNCTKIRGPYRNPVATARVTGTRNVTRMNAQCGACKAPVSDSNSPTATSLAENGLDLDIQRFPLRRLAAHWAEPSNLELLASLLGRIRPLLQSTVRELLLAQCRSGLAHDLASFALRQTAHSLHPLAAENGSSLPDLLDFHGLLGLHRLHRLHGLRGLHGFHHRRHGDIQGESDKEQSVAQALLAQAVFEIRPRSVPCRSHLEYRHGV